MKQARIQYIAENPGTDINDIAHWLNLKACDGWTLLAVDDGVYIFGREGRFLYELDAQSRLMEVPFGRNS